MADFQAGKRYAQAAFGIARDSGQIARWRSDLDDVATVLAESDAASLFADARVAVERRQQLAERVLDVSPLALNLARVMIAKGRAADARAVADAFNQMADTHEGIAYADVTSAVELTPAELAALAERLGSSLGMRVTVRQHVDPSIVGGLIIRIGDRVLDGSIRTRLKSLRRELVGAR
jgi:F-type H+-transporting ATPase subunit delta